MNEQSTTTMQSTTTTKTTKTMKLFSEKKNCNWDEMLNSLCYINDDAIVLDYTYFKYFAVKETYSIILNYIITQIDHLLSVNNYFVVNVNMKNLTISDIDKHKTFIQNISTICKNKYPNKLLKCYIYNAPFVFSQIYNIVSMFIDKVTQQKIELISPNKK